LLHLCTSHTADDATMVSQNHFLESNRRHIFSFLHPILVCRIAY
jgi:hypothetical protein